MAGIGPTPWGDPSTCKRNFGCFFYRKCLDTACIAKNWESFTCHLCPLFGIVQDEELDALPAPCDGLPYTTSLPKVGGKGES